MTIAPTIKPPAERRKITVAEFAAMYQAGILSEDEHLELINGELITMAAMDAPHLAHVMRLARLLIVALRHRANVSVQSPIVLGEYSEPEPDVAVLRWREDDYCSGKPTAKDVLLVVEVADRSLLYDRETKLPLYAQHGITEVWILNLQAKQVEVYRNPQGSAYQEKQIFKPSDRLAMQAFPDLQFPVSEMFIVPKEY
ncbi:MAG: Uma2 family endonuclease [Chloroherpetonaceae bacterium]|nr:Uma2 family endonuclease [Chloroherpetonaceae bacterium]MDW8019096.1 Uma2 family endonuclease [Chloroherpetonaceae bacterium]MDW8464876.1 Uma2 family endonuclease [Chloroherpetonaceae bacterium]